MAGTRPGGQWLFSESVQALRDLKSRFEALDRDANELSVVLLQVRKPCPDFRKLLPKEQQGRCLLPESALDVLKWWLCDPDGFRQRHLNWKDQNASVQLNNARRVKTSKGVVTVMSDDARRVNSGWSVGFRHPLMPETTREYLIYPDPDPDAARTLQAISKETAILIHNAMEAFGPDAFRLLWPEIPVDSLSVGPGMWFDLVFEAGRWGLPSLSMRCHGKGRTVEELESESRFDVQPRDLWTNPEQPSVLTIPLERFASKSAAVIDLLIRWGESGVNPWQCRVDAQDVSKSTGEKNPEANGESSKSVEPPAGGDKAGGGKSNANGKQPTGNRGRKKGSTASDLKEDHRIADAWKKGQGEYATHEQLANALKMNICDVKAALDRHRKRTPSTETIPAVKRRQGH